MTTFEQNCKLVNEFVDALKKEALATGVTDPGGNAYISGYLEALIKHYLSEDMRRVMQNSLAKMKQEQQK